MVLMFGFFGEIGLTLRSVFHSIIKIKVSVYLFVKRDRLFHSPPDGVVVILKSKAINKKAGIDVVPACKQSQENNVRFSRE